MKRHSPEKKCSGKEIKDRQDILKLVYADAVVDLKDGFCMCYKMNEIYDFKREKDRKEFLRKHAHIITVHDFEVYKCLEKS